MIGQIPHVERAAEKAMRSDRWRPRLRTTYLCAAALTLLAFVFRFLTFRGFTNDQFQHLAWAQQMAHGALPGRDFLEPGMPLTIALSAVVQRLTPGPFGEAVLGELMLALATGVTCLVTTEFTASLLAGIAAALVQIGLEPRLYNYPKLLVPAVLLLLLQRYLRRRSRGDVVLLSAWTVAAFLFRHDLGLIAAAAVCAALIWPAGRTWRATWRGVALYIGAGLCLVAPYLLFIVTTTGLMEHVRVALEFTKVETHQAILLLDTPSLPAVTSWRLSTWSPVDASAFLYWLYEGLLVAITVALVARRRRMDDGTRATVSALLVLLAGYRVLILRYSLVGRVADVAPLIAIAGLWCFTEARRTADAQRRDHPFVARFTATLATVVAVVTAISIWTQPALSKEVFEETGLDKGVTGVLRQAAYEVSARNDIAHYWPVGDPPAVLEYVRRCTSPTDRLLLTWTAPEYYILSGRQFAGAHAIVLAPRALDTPRDEAAMLDGLTHQEVPVVLVNKTSLPEFDRAYPSVTSYLREHYREVGEQTIRDGSEIGIDLRDDLTGLSRFNGWPCTFRREASHALRATD